MKKGLFWSQVAGAAVDGVAVALVSEIGAGIREWLHDRRSAARDTLREERRRERRLERELEYEGETPKTKA